MYIKIRGYSILKTTAKIEVKMCILSELNETPINFSLEVSSSFHEIGFQIK